MSDSTKGWQPTSWQDKTASQMPTYPDPEVLNTVMGQLSRLPPLVTSWEIETLKAELARAARGELFLLQGGDCAESFDDCESDAIAAKLKILLQMSVVLVHATRSGVIRVARIAGQYAKPRSSDSETRDGQTLPTYRGDLVNRPPFTVADRTPDPSRLLRGYERAGLTLNFIRSLVDAGFADLHHPEYWDLDFVQHSSLSGEYERIVDEIQEALEFMTAVTGRSLDELRRVELFTSHEGLSLHYEQAQTRQVPRREGWYNLGTHMPWIGKRTASLDGAHVEYFRGIRNPMGVKIGPGMDPKELTELIRVLHEDNEPGRLVLIHRFGADKVAEELPKVIETVKKTGNTVLFCCDPMHGNTESTKSGIKTRRFENIESELTQAFEIHHRMGSILGGVHFEMTGQNVTECIGGARGLDESDLTREYKSLVDPRLNYEQALEMSMLIARHLRR